MLEDILETATPEQPETAEIVNIPTKTLHVSLSTAEFPKVEKCCFCFDLKPGVYTWLTIEALIWTFFFISTFIYEIILASTIDLLDFSDLTETWHLRMFFGNRLENADHAIRTYVILIYMLLTLFFLIYVVACVVAIIGIKLRKTCFFIPYFTLDAIFFTLAVIGCLTGLIISYDHLFGLCLLFIIIKVYVEICVVSLFMHVRHEKRKLSEPGIGGVVFQDNQASAV